MATVITNLLSAIPVFGQDIVELIWGGFSVSNATLNRFFSLHYILPFVLAVLALGHIIAKDVDGFIFEQIGPKFIYIKSSPNIILSSLLFSLKKKNALAFIIPNIKAKYRIGPHNEDIISVLVGSLLGDAHAEYRKQGKGTRISFMQEASHLTYINWLHDLISNLKCKTF